MKFTAILILVLIAFYNADCASKKKGNSNSSKSTKSKPSNSGVSQKPGMNKEDNIATTENDIIRSRTTTSEETKATTLPAPVTESSGTTAAQTSQIEENSSDVYDCDTLKDDKELAKVLNDVYHLTWYMENCYPFRVGDLLPTLI